LGQIFAKALNDMPQSKLISILGSKFCFHFGFVLNSFIWVTPIFCLSQTIQSNSNQIDMNSDRIPKVKLQITIHFLLEIFI
jgi:hypothetical protein